MPSSADKRMAKYAAKFDSTVIGTRYTATKGIATDAFNLTAPVLAGYEAQVKADILTAVSGGVPSIFIPAYLAFMRQCYAKARKYSGATLALQLQDDCNRWGHQGLDRTALKAIGALFGVTLSNPHW